MIQVLTTATLRPEILRRTYTSFQERLWREITPSEIRINVDPAGEDMEPEAVLEVAREFASRVTARIPPVADLPRAVVWTMSGATGHYCMWLEDDWEMDTDALSLAEMLAIMDNEPDLALLRLPRFQAWESEVRQWNKRFPWNGHYYEAPSDLAQMLGWSGNPSLVRGEFLRQAATELLPIGCPEKQLKWWIVPKANPNLATRFYQQRRVRQVLRKWRYGVYSKPGIERAVRDIGEDWRREHGVKKLHFDVTWQRKED